MQIDPGAVRVEEFVDLGYRAAAVEIDTVRIAMPEKGQFIRAERDRIPGPDADADFAPLDMMEAGTARGKQQAPRPPRREDSGPVPPRPDDAQDRRQRVRPPPLVFWPDLPLFRSW